jgi:MoCo/4Fe-4S cofactor protein with predicted Tat translocation signal
MDSAKGAKAKCAAQPSRGTGGTRLDLEAVRQELRGKRGPEYWRSLEELAGTAEFQEMLHREFPRQASEWVEPAPSPLSENAVPGVSRRAFLQLSSASLALAGLTACTRQPLEKIVPYVEQPEQVVPGRPLYFATTLVQGGYGVGVLAESHEGRPTKLEGNTEHPASLGSTDMFAQAAILELYDPARSQVVLHDGRAAMASTFLAAVAEQLRGKRAGGGQGLRLLTGAVTSPTFAAQIKDLAAIYPNARWHRWEPAGPLNSRAAAQRAFGRAVEVRYDLTRADVIAAFDADFLACGPGSVAYARQFADRRRVREASPELARTMNRLYVVETTPSPTGSIADHRLPLPPAEMEALLLALAQELGAAAAPAASLPSGMDPADAPAALANPKAQAFLAALAADLRAHPGASLVVAGETASPAAQVLAHAINDKLGNAGKTVIYGEPAEIDPVDHQQSLAELVRDIRAGQVDLLIMLGGVNPVYTAPADLELADALAKVKTRIHHGLWVDETAEYCHWHVPAAHALESWGDALAFDGTASLTQPLIEPLYGGRSLHEMMAVLLGRGETSGYDLVRATWKGRLPGEFEVAWRKALHDGVIPSTPPPPPLAGLAVAAPAVAAVETAAGEIAAAAAPHAAPKPLDIGGKSGVEEPAPRQLTLCFQPDPTIHDGSWAPNVWLQELPKPMTKLTWDNAVLISPATHQRLKLDWEERVRISVGGRKLDAAVWVLPGQADDTLTLSLGYGRRRAGENGSGLGFNAYVLRTAGNPWVAPGASLQGLGERYIFACTQNHHAIAQEQGIEEDRLAGVEEEKRHIVRTATLAEFQRDPEFAAHQGESPPRDMTLYPNRKYEGHAWGMAIDLNVCTGCSACVVACQAENNIPVVGKDQVMRHREMHWIRVDRYFTGDMDDPRLHNQPVPCMQCENAPCELVCPVGATAHSAEGLNDMTYNRCVGTRYCSNNCPYKVRRFNFLRYSDRTSPLAAMMYNPDVTVRMRGVMEKCTYCVQRIEHAKIESQVSGEPISEQRLKTACQQACPTQAIVFGDLNADKFGSPPSQVKAWKTSPLNYGMLDDLNTRPRTTYLARVTNPNPQLSAPASTAERRAPTTPTAEPSPERTT